MNRILYCTCFLDFLDMGCGRSSSSEKRRLRGSKSMPGMLLPPSSSSSSTSSEKLGAGRTAARLRLAAEAAAAAAAEEEEEEAALAAGGGGGGFSDAVGIASSDDDDAEANDATLSLSSRSTASCSTLAKKKNSVKLGNRTKGAPIDRRLNRLEAIDVASVGSEILDGGSRSNYVLFFW